jgi:hypothetical protein
MTRVRFVMMTTSVLSGILAALVVSCSSSSPSQVDAGVDSGKKSDAKADVSRDSPANDAGPQDTSAKDTVPTDAAVCNSDGNGGQGPEPADASFNGCGTTIGNCLGVGAACDPSADAAGVCLAAAAAFPAAAPICQPYITFITPYTETVEAGQDAGACIVLFGSASCGAGCGPGATCCSNESMGFAACIATSCVPITLMNNNAPPGTVCGDMGNGDAG